MEQLKKLYADLSQTRLAIVAAVAVTLGVLGFLRWQTTANFKPLYTSLSAEDAGAVIQKLKEGGIEYQISDNGGTILVPVDHVAESRLDMALAGLPKTGRIGFELFDRTNLGVTEFAEHINYQRALEGELERSVMSLAEVQQARVHIALAKDSVFTQSREPAKASVLVKLRPGVTLAPRSVLAISHLVAAAVEGLSPQAVSVLDMDGNLLSRPRSNGNEAGQSSDSFVEYQQALEKGLADKIDATLEPLLGAGRYRAGVSIECDFTTSEQSEELFNPEQSVITSSHVTEESNGGRGAAGGSGSSGIPGTASALPRARPDSGPTGAGVSRRSENTTYQTSRTVRRSQTPQGKIKRISAAVLVDYSLQTEGEGDQQKRTLQPRPPDRMDAIKELVSAAIGLDTARGDQLIVQTMPFEMTLQLQDQKLEAPVVKPGAQQLIERFKQDPMMMGVGAGVILVVLCAVGWMFMRSRKKAKATAKAAPAAIPAGAKAQPAAHELDQPLEASRIADTYSPAGLGAGSVPAPRLLSGRHETLVREAQDIVRKDSELSAGIVHGWLVEESQP